MGFLTDTAAKSARRLRRKGHVPEWMALAPIGGTIVVAVVVVIAFLLPGQAPDAGPPPTDEPGVTTLPPVTETTVAATEMVEQAAGGSIEVPSAAVELARSAAVATWTGNWTGVPTDGTAPVIVTPYPATTLLTIKVLALSPDVISFLVTVDLNGDQRPDSVPSTVVVQRTAEGWIYPVLGA